MTFSATVAARALLHLNLKAGVARAPSRVAIHRLATASLMVAAVLPAFSQAQEATFTLGGLLKGLKDSVSAPQVAAPVQAAPGPDAAAGSAPLTGSAAAVPQYTRLIQELAARGDLPAHQWGTTYLLDRKHVMEYTPTSIPGMYSLRHVRPDDPEEAEKWAKANFMIFEWQPIVFFTADGSGFFVRKENAEKGSSAWIVYDKNAGGYKTGEAARPYIQQMLTTMDVTGLPQVGTARPTFILYSSPSCPFSLKIEPQLAKSGMSYRVFPTYTVNPGVDFPDVHRIFCAKDKLAAWKDALRRNAKGPPARDRTGSWWCSPTIMPVLPLRDLDFIFGQGYGTPSYYFADGTVITGVDKIEAIKAKSREMAAQGLFFK